LEDRRLLAIFTVSVAADDPTSPPVGSLRWAILQANQAADLDTINFQLPGTPTIAPTAPLPAVTTPVIFDGTTQTGFKGSPLVTIDGTSAGGVAGLELQAAGNQV